MTKGTCGMAAPRIIKSGASTWQIMTSVEAWLSPGLYHLFLAGDGTGASKPVAKHARCTPSVMLGRRELDGLLEIRHIN
jgi:hypothetical protein